MSMDATDTTTVYTVKKKDGSLAMRVTLEYFDQDYAQLVALNGVHLSALNAMLEIGKGEAERRKSLDRDKPA